MMRYLIIMAVLSSCLLPRNVFNFTENSDVSNWVTVDDVVMGGKSFSSFRLNSDGYGVFEGSLSTDNNGGFCSVHYTFNQESLKGCKSINIRLLGDGLKYQCRIKSNSSDYFSYISPFTTSGKWQEIKIPLKTMFPSFRGRRLEKPYFSNTYFEQITFLIANKKNVDFKLLIDRIELVE